MGCGHSNICQPICDLAVGSHIGARDKSFPERPGRANARFLNLMASLSAVKKGTGHLNSFMRMSGLPTRTLCPTCMSSVGPGRP